VPDWSDDGGSTDPSTPSPTTSTIVGMMYDDDLYDLYEQAWNDGWRAAVLVLIEADDDQLDQDEDDGTTVTPMGDTGNGKIEASGVVMFLACAAAAVAAVGAWGELTRPIDARLAPTPSGSLAQCSWHCWRST
jgi:hypothetical protein